MDTYLWPKTFRKLFESGLSAYRAGRRDAATMFDAGQKEFLAGLGASAAEMFDFVEDNFHGGDPDFESVLLITAVRREYFLTIQHGQPSSRAIDMAALPSKGATLEGIEWLPRIIEKARAKLRGEMPPELMYCCGGDRAFLCDYGIHPADFLREVWAVKEDRKRIVEFVRNSAAQGCTAGPAAVCQILPGGRVKC